MRANTVIAERLKSGQRGGGYCAAADSFSSRAAHRAQTLDGWRAYQNAQ